MKLGEVATLREQDSICDSYETVGRQGSWWGKGAKYRARGYIQGTGFAGLSAGSAHRIKVRLHPSSYRWEEKKRGAPILRPSQT